jgi:hypothetical protein
MLSHMYNGVTSEPTMMWYVSLVRKLSEFVYSKLTIDPSDIIEGCLIIYNKYLNLLPYCLITLYIQKGQRKLILVHLW